jgi:hypothetical protein
VLKPQPRQPAFPFPESDAATSYIASLELNDDHDDGTTSLKSEVELQRLLSFSGYGCIPEQQGG